MTQPIPEHLVCPVCKGPLAAGAEAKELLCPRCALAYEVRAGIPVMIAERARKLSDEEIRALKERLKVEGGAR